MIAPTDREPGQLVFDDVTRCFDGTAAISGVSFSIAAGERVALVGPSGAGKTTLLRLASGVISPDSGNIRLDGDPLTGHDAALAYGGHTLVDRRTALANVLGGGIGSLSWLRGFLEPFVPRDSGPALELLDAVGLAGKADARADTLSAGERQRVALARALMQDARVVLADEPTANLDPSSRANVLDLIEEAVGARPLLTALHEIDLARDRFERVVGLADGRVRFDEPAEAVTDDMLADLFAAGASTPDGPDDRPYEESASEPTDSCTRVRWYA